MPSDQKLTKKVRDSKIPQTDTKIRTELKTHIR